MHAKIESTRPRSKFRIVKQEDFELLEAYLLHRLERKESVALENRLKSNPELAAACNELEAQIQAIGYARLKEKLAGYEIKVNHHETVFDLPQRTDTTRKTQRLGLRITTIAASVALIGLVLFFLVKTFSDRGPDLNEIFYQDPGLPTVMSGTDRYQFYDAMVDYKTGKYEVAIDKWSDVRDVGKDTIDYYTGMALIGMDMISKALDRLELVPASSILADKAKWYRVGLLIRMEEFDEAEALLETIPHTFEGYDQIREFLSQK